MRVVFDANPLFPLSAELGPTGVGRWTAGAIRHLANAAPDWQIEAVAFHLRPIEVDTSWLGENVRFRLVRFSNRAFRALKRADLLPALERFIGPIDAMVGTAYITWRTRWAAEIPVVYDLSFFRYPETVSRRNLNYLRSMLPRVLRRADLVITISEAMREEIVDEFSIDSDRICVVPPGCDLARFGKASEAGRVPDLPDRYLLFVGTLEPRKNLLRLLDAHSSLTRRRPDTPPLVVVGGMGWHTEPLRRRLASGATNLVILGYVDDASLPRIYAGATALIFPSLYEGFGLPVLEAMAAGCPVITSDRGGIPEVAGDAALTVDPADASQIERAIELVVDDPDLASAMASKGKAQAALYSWERTGNALKESIEKAVSLRKPLKV